MTIEQIVAQHPCPIIRGKIMENLATATIPKEIGKEIIDIIDYFGWDKSKEGYNFWNAVFESLYYNRIATYSDLKHLDLSYTHEPAKPPVMWRKIDPNNLCTDSVVAIDNDHTPKQVVKGTLELTEDDRIRLYLGGGSYMYRFTHYIPLSDLISLPIE